MTGGSLQLCCTGRESLVRRRVCSITPMTDGGLARRPKGAVGLLHQKGEPRPTLNRQGDSRRGWRIGWRAPGNRREPAALLHREGEPRPPQSMQHSSDDRRRAHPATGGSRGSAAPEGEPSPMLRKQGDVTDGGTLTASEGSCGSAAPEGRVPLFSLVQGAVLACRKKGSRYNRREPAALLHREWEPRPLPSAQRNSKWQTEASHCDRREPWVCCTGRGAPSDAEEQRDVTNGGTLTASEGSYGSAAPEGRVPLFSLMQGAVWRVGRRAPVATEGSQRLCCAGSGSPVRYRARSATRSDGRRRHTATEGSRGSAAPEGEPRPMLKKQKDVTDGGTLTASEGSCGSAAPEGRVPLFSLMQGAVWRVGRRAPITTEGSQRLCCTGSGSPVRHRARSATRNDRRRRHTATEGSRGSAAPEGEPCPTLNKQRDATDGGTLTASEGSCSSAAPEGRVPLAA